jgi:putative NADH-flavin reductase
VAGHDVVISAAHFATLPASAVIGPVKQAGVNRLLVVGGAGSLAAGWHPGDRQPGFPAEYKAEASAGAAFLETCVRKGSGLDLPVAIGRVCRRRAHRQIPHRQG